MESGGNGMLGQGALHADVTVPTLLFEFEDMPFKQIGCGALHTAALTESGEVWACGTGEYGRLASGQALSGDQLNLEPVDGLDGKVIKSISVGNAFTLALSEEGELYCWGRNDTGQLGQGGGLSMDVYCFEDLPVPVLDSMDGEIIVDMSAGHGHAAAVTNDGKLFMWGMKRYLEPEYMSVLEGKKVTGVACGDKITAALTDEGEVYTFGPGKFGSLGHGNTSTEVQPKLVEALQGLKVVKIACGDKHVAALVEF
ncbi:unnamed protein product [Chrysoparadoxa australica]